MMKRHEKVLIIGGGVIASLVAAEMAIQFPLVITATAKKNKAEIRISGAIYNWNNSSEEITSNIDQFLADGIKDVDVYINSPGGDVFEAAEIENQIHRFPGIKKGIGGAIVASAATKIAVGLDSFEMAENGQWMYHKPSGFLSGNEDAIESSLTLLKNLTSQYKADYSAKTGISEKDIEANWSKGDVWLTAKDAQKQKFISGVIKRTAITPETKAMIAACGSPTVPDVTSKQNSNNKNSNKIMDKEKLALLLGLESDASDAQIEAALKAQKEAAGKTATLEKEKTDSEAAELKNKVDALINGGLTAKKYDATQAENLRSWAMNDFTACENYINGLKPLGKISAAVVPATAGGGAGVKAFKDMDQAERDELLANDPDAFKAAYIAYLAD